MQTVISGFSKYTFITEEGKLVCYNTKGQPVQPKGAKYYLVNNAGNKCMVPVNAVVAALKVNNGFNRYGEEPDYSVKLNKALAQYIRFRVAVCGVTITHLANAFNVDHETIAMVVKNITYKDPAYFTPIKYAKPVKYNPALLPAVIR